MSGVVHRETMHVLHHPHCMYALHARMCVCAMQYTASGITYHMRWCIRTSGMCHTSREWIPCGIPSRDMETMSGVHTRNVISPAHHARGACTGMVHMCYSYAPCIAYMQCNGACNGCIPCGCYPWDIHRYGIPYPMVWVYHLM